jgi:hypothetical protein
MQDVFQLRERLIEEYGIFSRSFTHIAAIDIRDEVDREYDAGRYWPEPLIQINPNYQRKDTIQSLVTQGLLHRTCGDIFRTGKTEGGQRGENRVRMGVYKPTELKRPARETAPALARRAGAKKSETGSGFWDWWWTVDHVLAGLPS